MTRHYLDLVFTPSVKEAQKENGSSNAFYGKGDGSPDMLGEMEQAFISRRNSFYLSTISQSGWPYMQHRGGPTGFVKILDKHTIGIADYRGNRQYVSLGNIAQNNRAALFFMDYANQYRLKLLAKVRIVDMNEEPELITRLSDPAYNAKIERGFIFEIEAFDWNCQQHIAPRFTQVELGL